MKLCETPASNVGAHKAAPPHNRFVVWRLLFIECCVVGAAHRVNFFVFFNSAVRARVCTHTLQRDDAITFHSLLRCQITHANANYTCNCKLHMQINKIQMTHATTNYTCKCKLHTQLQITHANANYTCKCSTSGPLTHAANSVGVACSRASGRGAASATKRV